MMTLDQVVTALKERRLTAVAETTGLHYDTVRRVAAGDSPHVSYQTVKVLSEYLEGK